MMKFIDVLCVAAVILSTLWVGKLRAEDMQVKQIIQQQLSIAMQNPEFARLLKEGQ